jgi:leucyl aminopeptidase (aminopeptidase T)
MKDPRFDRLAEILLDHSCQLRRGEKVLIEAFDLPDPALVCRLVEMAAQRGAVPLTSWKNSTVLRSLYRTGTEANIKAVVGAGAHSNARAQDQMGRAPLSYRQHGPSGAHEQRRL